MPRREDLEATSRRFDIKFLLAVMNSDAACDFLRANRRSNIHIYPDDWKKLPIPEATKEQQADIVALVDQILDLKRQYAEPCEIEQLEIRLDALINNLFSPPSCPC